MSRLREKYNKEVVPSLLKERFKNVMEVPKITKITVSMGVGEGIKNPKALESAVKNLEIITAQKPIINKARKSVATFKVRQGMNIGCQVTLHGDRMYEFFDKFVSLVIPRIKDFRGFSKKAFDGRGNYNVGLKEQNVFPELTYDDIDRVQGMSIAISTSAKNDADAVALFEKFGFPFKK
jgi:large subunit ribosomal protein L5